LLADELGGVLWMFGALVGVLLDSTVEAKK
jgi:hypothetical protein